MFNFNFTPPTEEEMIESATRWYSKLEGLTVLDYNETLKKHCFHFDTAKLPKEFVQKFLSIFDGKYKPKDLENEFSKILINSENIDSIKQYRELNGYNTEYFVKLISRSPKDYLYDKKNYGKPKPLKTSSELLEALACSMRTFEDMVMLEKIDKAILVIMPYYNFHPSTEWRVLIKDKHIVGISQYYYESVFNYDIKDLHIIDSKIRNFITEIVIPNISKDSFIADVICDIDSDIKLLETNPYGLSDPCLFKDYNSLDGTFKYNTIKEMTISTLTQNITD